MLVNMSTTKEEKYVQLMERMQVDYRRREPTLENIQWFIRTGYGHHKDYVRALDALNIAYQLQTKIIQKGFIRPRPTTCSDAGEYLQNVLKR